MVKIKVTVERIDGHCNLPMLVGDYFFIEGSKILIPENQYICMWALQSMIPIFPIFFEQSKLNDSHWAKKVKKFSCPDPKGLVQFILELIDDDQG